MKSVAVNAEAPAGCSELIDRAVAALLDSAFPR
jgi:hypothetical protein